MRLTEVGTPVTSSDGHNTELGDDDGGADGSGDFLGGLDTRPMWPSESPMTTMALNRVR